MSTRAVTLSPIGRWFVSADLPDLPGVPAAVGPVGCPGCGQRAAVVRHVSRGDGSFGARLECSACGDSQDLYTDAYAAGLAAGVLIEAARRGDPRVTAAATPGGQVPAGGTR